MKGYVITIAPTYLLYSYWDRRRRFWITFTLLLITVPFVSSTVDYWLFSGWLEITESFNSQGFSGVASAFGGMLLASIGLFVADEYDRSTRLSTVNAVVIVAFGLLAFVSGILSPLLIGLIAVGTALLGGQFITLAWVREPARFGEVFRENRDAFLLVVYGGLVVCWLLPRSSPST